MSLRKLHHEVLEVGKRIKSSKICFFWEFILNSKTHKIELFHSKLSGKKELCVDSRTTASDKEFKNNFNYSFKIDNKSFTVIQLSDDEYDLRIDNRSFNILIQEEKTTIAKAQNDKERKKQEAHASSASYAKNETSKFEKLPAYLRTKGSRDNDAFYSKEDPNFTNDNKEIKLAKTTQPKENTVTLLEYGSIANDANSNKQVDIKTTQTYNHNKSIFNNLNFFGEDHQTQMNIQPIPNVQAKNYSNNDFSYMNQSSNNNQNNNNNSNNSNQFANDFNQNFGNNQYDMMNINMNMNSNNNQQAQPFNSNKVNSSYDFMNMNQPMTNPSIDNSYGYNIQQQQPYMQQVSRAQESQPQYQYNQSPIPEYKPNIIQPIAHIQQEESQLKHQQSQPVQIPTSSINNTNAPTNQLKTNIMKSGLVNLDDLLGEHKSNTNTQSSDSKYNFNSIMQYSLSNDYSHQNNPMNNNQNYNFNQQFQQNSYDMNLNSNINDNSRNSNVNQEKTPFDF